MCLMSTFSLEQIILIGTEIIRFFKAFSHYDLYTRTYENLQNFALGTEIVNKSDYVGFICNVLKYLY
jgi:hypothetical protein